MSTEAAECSKVDIVENETVRKTENSVTEKHSALSLETNTLNPEKPPVAKSPHFKKSPFIKARRTRKSTARKGSHVKKTDDLTSRGDGSTVDVSTYEEKSDDYEYSIYEVISDTSDVQTQNKYSDEQFDKLDSCIKKILVRDITKLSAKEKILEVMEDLVKLNIVQFNTLGELYGIIYSFRFKVESRQATMIERFYRVVSELASYLK